MYRNRWHQVNHLDRDLDKPWNFFLGFYHKLTQWKNGGVQFDDFLKKVGQTDHPTIALYPTKRSCFHIWVYYVQPRGHITTGLTKGQNFVGGQGQISVPHVRGCRFCRGGGLGFLLVHYSYAHGHGHGLLGGIIIQKDNIMEVRSCGLRRRTVML